jgi:hypothetical protein
MQQSAVIHQKHQSSHSFVIPNVREARVRNLLFAYTATDVSL